MRSHFQAFGLTPLAALVSISCAHRGIDITTPVRNVKAEVERSDGEFIYTIHLPNAAGG